MYLETQQDRGTLEEERDFQAVIIGQGVQAAALPGDYGGHREHALRPLPLENRPPWWGGRNLSAFEILQQWDHARNQPFFPHLINLALEEIDVFIGEMRKSPLLE